MKYSKLAAAFALAGLCATSAHASLSLTSAFQGAALSIDALGIETNVQGTLRADVAAGSTVERAYLYVADVWGNGVKPVTFGGTVFDTSSGTLLAPNANLANTYRYDVTSIVKSVIDGGPGGFYNFGYKESGFNDGGVLVVAYKNASTAGGTAIILDGELATGGDTFRLNFSSPYTSGAAVMSLASSYSYNGNSTVDTTGQVTIVDVRTNSTTPTWRRLTSCAGGNDDGNFVNSNGMLITAGGIGDSTANPNPYCDGGAGDDEFYDLSQGNSVDPAAFLNTGDTFVEFKTLNPSNNDNVFGLFFTSSFKVTQVNDTPIDDNTVPEPSTLALTGLAIAGLARRRTK